MESITINFANSKDILILRQIIEDLGLDVSFEDVKTINIPDELYIEADKNFNEILQGTRKTKSWEQVKAEILAKNA